MLSTPYDVSTLVGTIVTQSAGLNGDNGEARRKCLDAARSLVFALETPVESILKTTWAEQGHHAAIRAGIHMGLFEKLDEEDGVRKSSYELAEMTKADPVLVGRLLKHLAAMGTIYETGANEYISTPFSKALKNPIYRDAYPTVYEICGPPFIALPDFLLKSQFKNPVDSADGAFQQGHGEKDHFFEWVSKRPERLTQFQNHMAGYRTGRPSWMDSSFYPVEENLVSGAKTGEDSVFLVDVGGGRGHDLQELYQKHPALPGKLVLQDLQGPIEEAKAAGFDEDKKFIAMPHDFFSPQPVIGARAYYLHSCLHDWPDDKAREILLSVKPGLVKGYSKLLINENVIPDQGAHWLGTALDMVMMSNFSASERTEQNWKVLLQSAGFKILKVWTYEQGTESLIEAELA